MIRRALHRNSIAASLVLISSAVTACSPGSASSHRVAPVLLFTGTGTSPNDVAAIEAILKDSHLDYSTVNSFHLNGMAESQISEYRLLIVPGGDFVKMGNSLTSSTAANVRNAVKSRTNYLGICAGGFLAGHFPASYNSFNLTSGVQFGFYAPESKTLKTAVRIRTPGGSALDQYWESGPVRSRPCFTEGTVRFRRLTDSSSSHFYSSVQSDATMARPPEQITTRPSISHSLTAHEFRSWYWLKAELISLCRLFQLQTTGSKLGLEARILSHLSGVLMTPPATKEKQVQCRPSLRCRLSLEKVGGATQRLERSSDRFVAAALDSTLQCETSSTTAKEKL